MPLRICLKTLAGVALAVLLCVPFAHALPGDVNSSGRVDGHDLIRFGRANGTVDGDARFNPDADLDRDGDVDADDLAVLSTHFGKNGVSFGLWAGTQYGTDRVHKLSRNANLLQSAGGFSYPMAIAPDADGTAVWVIDYSQSALVKLDNFDGSRLATVTGLRSPRAVAVDYLDGSIWVADSLNGRILKFDPGVADGYNADADTGAHIAVTGFNQPFALSVDPEDDSVWVADTYNNRLVRLDTDIADGYQVGTDTGSHHVVGGFSNPQGVSVNISDGSVWVADTGNKQVVRISGANFTELFRAGGYTSPVFVQANYVDGSAWVADQAASGQVVRLGPDGTILAVHAGLNNPRAVAVNPLDGSCWTHTSGAEDEIVQLSPLGTEVVRVGTFNDVQCLAVIPDETTAGRYPVATAQLSAAVVDAGDTVTLTGTGSDPDGTIIKYEWDYDGDGVFEYSHPASGTTTATYLATGIYNPAFRVTDDDFFTATDYSQVLRVGTLTAAASADVTSGGAPLTVNFTGTFTDPVDGRVASFQWDFDGDAAFDYYSESTAGVQHTYTKAGVYSATFKVTDGIATATATVVISVSQSAPQVTVQATPASGVTPLAVQLSESTTDPDGTVILYEWDFDNDGVYDWHSTVNGQTAVTLSPAGTYVMRLKVTDNDGLTGTGEVTVEVGEIAPTATANADVTIGHADLTVNFDADGSSDPDGTIVKYEWDFDGNGTYDFSSAATGDASHVYETPGVYSVVLRVTDNDGNTGTDSVDVTVAAADVPVATAGADSLFGMAGDTINFTGSGVVPEGSITSYQWNFGEEYVWAADENNDQLVRLYPDGSGEIARIGGVNNPKAVAVVPDDGTVWSADYYGHALVRFSADGRTELVRVPDMSYPVWVDVDPDDDAVWTASTGHDKIFKHSETGVQLAAVPGFWDPECLAVNAADGSVWVADTQNNRIVLLDASGVIQKVVTGFDRPAGISVNPNDGTVWVSDTYAHQVVRVASDAPDGYHIGTDTGSHVIAGGFYYPRGIDVDTGDDTVWVADNYHGQVVHLSADAGTELARVSGISYPDRLSVNPVTHGVWVSSTGHNVMVKLDEDGMELARLDGFYTPRGVDTAVSGPGNFYTSGATGDTSHTYTEPGVYRAVFTVTADSGDTHSRFLDITIQAAPTVTASASAVAGSAPLEVFLSADARDRDGGIVLYEWDFDGIGGYEYSSTQTGSVRHVYPAGDHTATVRVTDTDGHTATDTVALSVDTSPPVASADAAPVSGNAPLDVNFTGSATDPDGTIVLYEWDFGEGSGFAPSATGSEPHTYSTAGDYTAVLRVTDDDGLTHTDTVDIHVNPAGTPVALLGADTTRGRTPLDVCVYIHGLDEDGTVDGYAMDWDGDGGADQSWDAPPTAFGDNMELGGAYWTAAGTWARTTANAHSGSYAWTDSPGGDYAGDTDAALTSTTIDLSEAVAPKLVFYHVFDFDLYDYGRVEVSGNDGANWTQIGYYGYDAAQTAWTRQSYDLSTYAGNATVRIRFRVTSDADDPADGWTIDDVWVGDCAPHTYAAPGVFTPTLTVTDNGANTASAQAHITVRSPDDATVIWEADTGYDQIRKYSEDGDLLGILYGFYNPYDVAVDPASGAIWVSQPDNDLVIRLAAGPPDGYNIGATAVTPNETDPDRFGMLFDGAAIGDGHLGSGLVLDGDKDFVQIPTDTAFDVQSFTVEAWVKTTVANSRTIFMRGNNSGHNEIYIGFYDSDTIEVILDNGSAKRFSGEELADGSFHHVAIVYDADAGTLTCYADGLQYGDTVTDLFVTLDFGTSNMLIGADFDSFNSGLGNYWSGTIDDVRFWNTARSGAEILAGKDAPLAGSEAGLVGYWKLDASSAPPHVVISGTNSPLGLAPDPANGSAWVADRYNDRAVRFDADGTQTAEVTGLDDPFSVDVDPVHRTLWIADFYRDRVIAMSADVSGSGPVRGTGSTPDATAGGSDGRVMGDAAVGTGRLSGGMEMDGSGDYVHVPYSPVFNVESFTVEAWVKGIGSVSGRTVFMRGNSTGANELFLGVTGQTTVYTILDNGTRYFYGGVSFQDGLFHHLALVYDAVAGSLTCYVDGAQYGDAITDLFLTLDFGESDIAIGADFDAFNGNPGDYWPGVIDDVRFWNTARSGADIAADMDGPLAGSEAGLVGYWKLDAAVQDTVIYHGFDGPHDVAADPSDNGAWVADHYHHEVVKLLPDGSEAHRVGGFDNPRAVSLNTASKAVWAADQDDDRAVKLTPDGVAVADAGGIDFPYDVAVNPDDGSVWVSDYYHHQLVKLAPDGRELLRVSGVYYPKGLAVDRIFTGEGTPPEASVSAHTSSGSVPFTVDFTGTGTDADGTVALYEWDFDGDGVVDYTSDSTGSTSFTYRSSGRYNPIFRVTDDDGLSGYDSTVIVHAGPITVTAEADPDQGTVPVDVTLDAVVAGLAPGNAIVSYAWDFDGDGVYDYTSAATPRVVHRYTQGGAWTAVIRVTDALGSRAYGSVTITVESSPPSAFNNATPTTGNLPLTVTLNGTASDADGSIVRYEWDYDGDGAYDWFSDATGLASFTYTAAGTYETRFRATDNDGLSTTAVKTISVGDSELPPAADASADVTEGYAPFTVNFTGTGLDPDDGVIASYEWDFDGDGTYDTSSTDSGAASHVYSTPGVFSAFLQVTDVDGFTDTDSILITVKEAGAPTAVANADPTAGDIPLTVNFDAAGSSDPDGDIVLYEWTFGSPVVWIADYSNHRVRYLEGYDILQTLGGFQNPHWVDLDPNNGTAWVADRYNDQVVKIKADGSGEIYRLGGFNNPLGVAVTPSDGSVWVTDTDHDQVVKLSDAGEELLRIGGFDFPNGVDVDASDDAVWIVDQYHHQVVKLAADGTELARVSGFWYPTWPAVDQKDGAVWVADQGNNRIVRLEAQAPNGYQLGTTAVTPNETDPHLLGMLFNDAAIGGGQLGSGVVLDGSGDCVQIPTDPAFDVQSFTVEAWVKTTGANSRTIFMRGNNSGQNEIYIGLYDSDTIEVLLDNGNTKRFTGISPVNLADGSFHHVAIVHDADANTLTCYVDGSQYGNTENVDVTLDFGTSNTLIGADFDNFNGALGNYWPGTIDDVRFWNTARSGAEILAGKDAPLAGNEAGLVGYWRLDASSAPLHRSLDGFSSPHHISVNPSDQTVWVAEYGNRVTRVSKDCDRIITRVGGFNRPYSTYIPPGSETVWVADHYAHEVVVMSFDGTILRRITGLYYPTCVTGRFAGNQYFSSAVSGTTTHTYPLTGEYAATLRVTDDDGNSDTDAVTIRAGIFPEALPAAYPTSGRVPLTVYFSCIGNSPTGTIEYFTWNFGDGSTAWTTRITENVTHTYTIPGTYTATLTVTDNRGLSHTAAAVITVLPPKEDGAPQAFASAHPLEGNAPLDVTLEGFGLDTDGFIRQFDWDFTDDGGFDFTSGATGITTTTYGTPGVYTARLRVTDDNGLTGTDTVRIQAKTENSPTAAASADPTSGAASLDVQFTGTGTDPDGQVVLYEWDYDGDGTYDYASAATAAVSHSFTAPGNYTAVLRVTDDNGLTDTDTVNLSVSAGLTATLSDDLFDPATGSVSINTVLTADNTTVTILIKNRVGEVVRTLVEDAVRSVGYYTDAWDGRDDGGDLVRSGVYLYVIAYSVGGVDFVYDLTNNVDISRSTPSTVYPDSFNPFDAQTNFFRYTLTQKSEVTIYIAPFSGGAGTRVKTLMLRKPQKAGSYVAVWDGTDDLGNLVAPGSYVIATMAWDLPENAIIVNNQPVISDVTVSPGYLNPDARPYDETHFATFSFTLSKTADVTASIYDGSNYIVKSITQAGVPAGPGNSLTWDGRNTGGDYVPPGTYRIKLIATDGQGNSSDEGNALMVVFY